MKITKVIVLLAICSLFIYLPVVISDDYMLIGIMYSIHIYFLVGAGIYIIYFINRHTKKMWHTLLLVILTLIIIASPRLIHEGYDWWKDYKHYHQDFTSESLQEKFYSDSTVSSPPLKYVSIRLEDHHVYLKMEYDPLKEQRKVTSKDLFQKDLLRFIFHRIRGLSPFEKLHRITYEIMYYDDIYVFEDIPLKNSKDNIYYGQVHSAHLISLLKSKMKIINGE